MSTSSILSPVPSSRLYEHLLTEVRAQEVGREAEGRVELEPLALADSHQRIARHVALEVERALSSVGGEKADRLNRQAAIANDLLARLRELAPPGPPSGENIEPPPRLLLSVHDGTPPVRTELPFAVTTVLTRARGEPSIGHELTREIASAEDIDALVSFVTVSGVRALREPLERHAQQGHRLRLLTTTYLGATDAEAIEALARLPNVQVRISYDARRTRLHAKAWLFSRRSGLDTAYVGSANLSSSALFHGHEWMVKVSAADLPAVIAKFRGTFDTLWNDPEFEPFEVSSEEQRSRLRKALSAERGGGGQQGPGKLTFFTLSPYPFQAEILDCLQAERDLHGRRRNLVVAATGTGKTVVAGFDYHRRIGPDGVRPRLLFLAHREEILSQALATFRNILRDGAFGDLLVGGEEPANHGHLFASIQSFNSRRLLDHLGADYWKHVVIDECHHAPAHSYRAIVEQIRPEVLVGLTATPERTDGQSLLPDFDGHIAAELRLWHALERQLLVPFEYYGISDNTDLRGARWSRGAYVTDDLEKLYTGNDHRASLVIEQTLQRVGDARQMRALGFCLSVPHAEFMARRFSEAGIPAQAVHGKTADEDRDAAPRRLERREVNVLFTCDLYNEGIDLPFVDTLLFLRPTSSATLFLQQLGRGLRLHEKKASCLVLDFIGQHREDFRFDRTLTAATGVPRGGLREAVERGFPSLPSGCHLELDRVAQAQVLTSLRRTLRGGPGRLVEELRDVVGRLGSNVRLKDFLEASGRDLEDVFSRDVSWTRLRRAAGLATLPPGPREDELARKLEQMLHIDEPERLELYRSVLADPSRAVPEAPLAQRRLLMLGYLLFHERAERFTPGSLLELLRAHPAVVSELLELCEVLRERISLVATVPLQGEGWPLSLHRRYRRREVLTAVGRWNESAKPDSREGLVRLDGARAELFFVTLDKSEKRFSPTTSYEDYALSADLFHWQTQSTVSPESATGRRYVEQAENGWRFLLLVRPTVDDAYTNLGLVRYVSHTGGRPMSITWRLAEPIPGRWLQEYERLVA